MIIKIDKKEENILYVHEIEEGTCQECGYKGYCIEFIIDDKSSFSLCKKCTGSALIEMLKDSDIIDNNTKNN